MKNFLVVMATLCLVLLVAFEISFFTGATQRHSATPPQETSEQK